MESQNIDSFYGESEHTLDQKGRVIIPTKIREVLKNVYGNGLLFLVRIEQHIEVYPIQEWKKREVKLREKRSRDESFEKYLRLQYSRADKCEVDRSGRVLLPSRMRAKCGIDSKVAIVGLMDHFEIWPFDKWEGEDNEMDANTKNILSNAGKQGL
ncbi:division/cell wall cluster transcriptional repressor MraZ [bacterium]|nr:division/cell wall cluster transcriptional repressor MraZ [bacterium]